MQGLTHAMQSGRQGPWDVGPATLPRQGPPSVSYPLSPEVPLWSLGLAAPKLCPSVPIQAVV